MPKQVEGFLANDGTFFEHEPECQRYELMKKIEGMCDSHKINFDNFMAVISAWSREIKGYYDANERCQNPNRGHQTTPEPDDDEPLPSPEGDIPYAPVGDKDAPGFLEQQVRGYK